ncbi:MAG TPA: hypothetical protein VJQ45_11330 [Ktedonobacterales bacterium]|nr:hypothetical protein [Ktedonobacterales bacterium]
MWLVFVIAFWILVFGLMMTLVRWVARANDDEQTVCDITDDYYAPAHTSSSSPTAPAT